MVRQRAGQGAAERDHLVGRQRAAGLEHGAERPGDVSGSNRTVTITPASGQSGTTRITVFVSDGLLTNSTNFTLTVGAVNTPPTISSLGNQSTAVNAPVGPLNFTIGDAQTPAASLSVSGVSANPTLVPDANLVFGGSGANRTVTINPAAGQTGSAVITLTVSDGELTASTSFTVVVTADNGGPAATYFLNEGFETPGYEMSGWTEKTRFGGHFVG